MKSPFPGMDPYLENLYGWRDFHHEIISAIREQLARQVTPHFMVRVEERVDIVEFRGFDKRHIVPDTHILSKPRTLRETAIGAITPPTFIEPYLREEIAEGFLEIRDAESREVVTVIEILSPTNKISDKGIEAFEHKRETVMQSNAHWIEIDLLRAGERFNLVAGRSDYVALLKRAHISKPYEVWFFNLRDKMPTIAVPLRPPFDDVPLDLQTAFDVTYERAYYADSIDYTQDPPEPALNEQDAEWVRERVRAWLDARAEIASELKSG